MPELYKSLFEYFSIVRRLEDNLSWELFLIMGCCMVAGEERGSRDVSGHACQDLQGMASIRTALGLRLCAPLISRPVTRLNFASSGHWMPMDETLLIE